MDELEIKRLVELAGEDTVELKEKRNYNSKHFFIGSTDDGKLVNEMKAHAGHIHYFDKLDSNRFREIDWKLKWNEDKRGWEFKYHNFRPFLPEYSNDWIEFRDLYQGKDQIIKYRPDCNRVKGRLLTAQETKDIVKEVELNSVIYDNAYGEGIDLILYFTRSALKKVVRIREEYKEIKDYSFDFEIELPKDEDDNELEVKRADSKEQTIEDGAYILDITKDKEFDSDKQLLIGNDKDDGKEWFTYIKGFKAWDSEKIKTIKVDYFIKDGKRFLRKKIDKEFIEKSVGDVFTDTTTPYYVGSGDGLVNNAQSLTYSTAHDATNGSYASDILTNARVRTYYDSGDGWQFKRCFIPIDTSGLGSGASISAATMYLRAYAKNVNDDSPEAFINILETTQPDTSEVTTADYNNCGDVGDGTDPNPDEVATRQHITNDISTAAYTLWPITDLTSISKTSVTKYGVREGNDMLNVAPGGFGSDGNNLVDFRFSEYANTSSDPYLSVTYTLPPTPVDVEKALAYRILTTPAETEKTLKYTVITTPAEIEKGLDYFIIIPTDIEKILEYQVTAQVDVNKDLAYEVKAPVDINKTLEYRVITTPAERTKGLEYTILTTPSEITKGLDYFIMISAEITKDLDYTIKSPQEVNKTLEYRVITNTDINKTLEYFILTTDDITKGLQYTIKAPVDIEKELEYGVLTYTGIEKALDYFIIIETDSTKGLQYAIITEIGVEKTLEYTILTDSEIQKGLDYYIITEIDSVKGLEYMMITKTDVTKGLEYTIITKIDTEKALAYEIIAPVDIQKIIQYTVITEIEISKGLEYRVITLIEKTKGLEYQVIVPAEIQKSLEYTVLTEIEISKALQYTIITSSETTKGLEYEVVTEIAITKGLQYTTITETGIEKSLEYILQVDPYCPKDSPYSKFPNKC